MQETQGASGTTAMVHRPCRRLDGIHHKPGDAAEQRANGRVRCEQRPSSPDAMPLRTAKHSGPNDDPAAGLTSDRLVGQVSLE